MRFMHNHEIIVVVMQLPRRFIEQENMSDFNNRPIYDYRNCILDYFIIDISLSLLTKNFNYQ